MRSSSVCGSGQGLQGVTGRCVLQLWRVACAPPWRQLAGLAMLVLATRAAGGQGSSSSPGPDWQADPPQTQAGFTVLRWRQQAPERGARAQGVDGTGAESVGHDDAPASGVAGNRQLARVLHRGRVVFEHRSVTCTLELVDLDGDGQPELRSCDERWVGRWCDPAQAPRPPRVDAWDARRGRFVPATSRFAPWLPMRDLEGVRDRLARGGLEPGLRRCLALQPALHLVAIGRADQGRQLFVDLDGADDAEEVAREVFDRAPTVDPSAARDAGLSRPARPTP